MTGYDGKALYELLKLVERAEKAERERDEARQELQRLRGIIANARCLTCHYCDEPSSIKCVACVLDEARTSGGAD